jgi:S-DNA-T family DNA segregation ATPase FtsK/SpoIIIE
LVFDLNDKDESHGPHGLIGGMPGSGKSELLRTIVLAFALTHHPNDLNFALIDYKGGATFNDLQNLPHTVGVVTDLESHASYVERVILSLTGEIKRREEILEQAKRTFGFEPAHIDKYRALPVKRPLPRLVVIFDEFAQFKLKHPEESKSLIEISRKGRSLGIHLVLATQNLREAVDDVVRQNSNFLIALRVSEPADSTQLIGIPDAAFLTKGRAYFRARSNSLFQAAFAGEKYRGMLLPDDAIIRILPDGKRQVVYPLNWKSLSVPADQPQLTEAQAIIDLIQRTADRLGIEKPPAVWEDPLPDRPDLPAIQAKADRMNWDGTTWKSSEYWPAPLLGFVDNPVEQSQFDFAFDPLEGGGHLIIFGSPGSGKSTLLRTIVTSLALGHSPRQVNIYIADLAGRPSLEIFRNLPHAGSVITQSESERVDRLVRTLREIGNTRSRLFARAQADDLRAYNQKVSEDNRLPVIFVVIDDLGELKRNYLDQAKDLSTLLNSGRSLGISFIISAISQNDLPTDAFNNIQTRITFNQADRSAYSSIVGYLSQARIESEFGSEIQPGRGLIRGNPPLLFQAALPTKGDDDDIQIQQLGEIVQEMHVAWKGKEPALPIRILEPLLPLRDILPSRLPNPTEPVQVVLGQDYETLSPAGFTLGDDGHLFLVAASGPKMGKTGTLLTWAYSMSKQYVANDIRFLVFDFHKRSLGALEHLPQTLVYVGRRNMLEAGLRELTSQVQQRREHARREDSSKADTRLPTLMVFIDDYYTFADECSDDEKKQLWDGLLNSRDLGMSLAFSADVSEAMADYSDLLVKKVRAQGSGILISPKEGNDLYRYAKIPQIPMPLTFGPGRGWLIKRGQARLIQVAMCKEVQS